MLPTNKQERKERPVYSGVLKYFPDAIAEVAYVSYVGNQQHNPGQPMHWNRHKSTDQGDCIVRHQLEAGGIDDDRLRHSAKVAWRALAQLQLELEAESTLKFVLQEDYPDSPVKPPGIIHGCPEAVETQILGGMTWPQGNGNGITVYVAGPMRGMEDNNFPTFDAARDDLVSEGYTVISPADIDRFAESKSVTYAYSDQTRFVIRDTFALIYLKQLGNPDNGVALLEGWHTSKGALAERATAEWLGLSAYRYTVEGNSPLSKRF